MVKEILAKSILNKHKRRDDWFLDDYSVNPYQGCPFNCIYCYTRGSKYGTHLARIPSVKVNAPDLLEKELARKAKKAEYGIIGFASQEAYLSVEKEYRITRKMLEIILKYRFPVHIMTKSTLVLRDLDILRKIDRNAILPEDLKQKLKRGVIISFSFSTLDEKMAKILEPRAPRPRERLETMGKCNEEGFLVGANFIPVLPFLSDSDEQLEGMIKAAKDYGADFVLVGGLTLFGEGPSDCKTLYFKFLKKYYPELLPKYRSLFRIFFAPPKKYQEQLTEKSKKLCEKLSIKYGIL